MQRFAVALGMTLMLAISGVAHAQSEDKAAAEASFRKGKALMAEGKTAEACAQFQRSQTLDPQLGTQYNLALCYDKLGRLASAWAELTELGAIDTNPARKADSARRARALEPRLTRMLIEVATRPDGLIVERDGKDVSALIDLATPVDPGEYELVARAPGHAPWRARVAFTKPGATIKVRIPALVARVTDAPEPELEQPDEPSTEPAPTPAPVQAEPAPPAKTARFNKRKLLALGVGGLGTAITAIGLAFGGRALVLRSDAEETCGGELDECYGDIEDARELIDDAREAASISNIVTGVGLAVLATGIVLYVTAPSPRAKGERTVEVRPLLGSDGAGVAIGGRF